MASATLGGSGTSLALQRVRITDASGVRDLTVRRVSGGVLEGWNAAGVLVREDLTATRQVALRRPQELLTAALVAGVYAVVFVVSSLAVIIDRP